MLGFIRSARLRVWITAHRLAGTAIDQLAQAYDRAFGIGRPAKEALISPDESATSNMQTTDIPTGLATYLHQTHDHAMFSRARYGASDGRTYSTSSAHLGNSLVCFYEKCNPSNLRAACIRFIFYSARHQRWKLVVQCYPASSCALVDQNNAPLYPNFPILMLANSLEPMEVIEPDWIHGHFACYQYSRERSLGIPLGDVRFIFFPSYHTLTH